MFTGGAEFEHAGTVWNAAALGERNTLRRRHTRSIDLELQIQVGRDRWACPALGFFLLGRVRANRPIAGDDPVR
jgi:hypothetical protein